MPSPSPSLAASRSLVVAAIVLTCVLFTRQALDPVNVVKLTALLLCALALVVLGAAHAVRQRRVLLPLSLPGAATALLIVALTISAFTAPVGTTALVGTYGRNSGLLAYLAALVLFLAALHVLSGRGSRVLVAAVTAAGLFTAVYGLLQKAGLDAIPWNNPFNPVIAALGNPNFASGYLGTAAAVGVGGALYAGWAAAWRIGCGVTAALCLTAAALSASVQGPIAAAGGLFVVAVAFSLDLRSKLKRVALSVLSLTAVAGLVVLLLGAVRRAGPAGALFSDVGSEARRHYWDAALQMFREQPLLGVGLDQYGNFWRSARSPEAVAALGGANFSDAAHSVPLQMLAQGGLLLGTAYGVFVLMVLGALVRGLRTLHGPDRMLLGAVGGGWAAYQVQSAVSIDQVPLIVLHFVLAGGVVAAAGLSGLRELRLPGAAEPVTPSRGNSRNKRRAAAVAPPTRSVNRLDVALLSVLALSAVAAAWQLLTPLRANTAAQDGDRLRALGNGNAALAAYQQAIGLLPGESFYWVKTGQLFQQVSPPEPAQARAALVTAARHNPYDVNALKVAAALAEQAGDLDESRTLHRRAVSADPLGPETLVAAARFELRHSGAEPARELLQAGVEQVPSSAGLWAALGDARAVLADASGARAAYEKALALDPADEAAEQGLAELNAAGA